MTSTSAGTADMFRSRRSSRNSSPSSCDDWDSIRRRSPSRTIAPDGPKRARFWRRRSRPGAVTNGASSCKAQTRASRRCSLWTRRRTIPTTARGRPSSRLTESSSPAPPCGSRPRLPILHRRPRPIGFIRPRRRSRDGWMTMKWRRCGNGGRSTESVLLLESRAAPQVDETEGRLVRIHIQVKPGRYPPAKR